MTTNKLLLLPLFLLPITSTAQKRIGDLIESTSYNTARMNMERTLQYYPEDGGFACVNGNNRYTRALYGGYTEYRIETSDRPIFAAYKKKLYRNIRMYVNGLRLDSAEYCKSLYKDGQRSYIVRDKAWGNRTMRLSVVAPVESETALWFATIDGDPVELKIITGEIANPKLNRNGDMGADKPGSFEPAAAQPSRKEFSFEIGKETCLRLNGVDSFEKAGDSSEYSATLLSNQQWASTITFTTPDPYFNTLGSALTFAANGIWDGDTHTWLHGAIGWRMPLAGWRAGFVGDVMGWWGRQDEHFDAYAASQVVNVEPIYPHPNQDSTLHLARAEKKWGTQMYSNGYICRNPNRSDQMNHYDMNLNYADELLWHFEYCPDTAYMRRMWPVLSRTIDWENHNYDPDGNGLYDGYACIWASDALYYGGGEAAHSTAYNYRLNRMAAKVASLLGLPNASEYADRADKIQRAANSILWTGDHWAEYIDRMGLRRLHTDAAAWSYYTPIDCQMGSQQQFHDASMALSTLPHIKVEWNTAHYDSLGVAIPAPTSRDAWVCSVSDWMPYSWSINNVAPAEVMHTALACFSAGNNQEGMRLMRGTVMDNMYLGHSPGNFGQVSYYDAARGECYRDFGDVVGTASRALVQGVFGIEPHGLDGECHITPGFAGVWDSVEVSTSYLSYTYTADKQGNCKIKVRQNFPCGNMKITFRLADGKGGFVATEGTDATEQTLQLALSKQTPQPMEAHKTSIDVEKYGLGEPEPNAKLQKVDMKRAWNANVSDIFNNEYLSPRPKTTSLEIPTQGIGEWCHPLYKPTISDSVFRSLIKKSVVTVAGIPFSTPAKGLNIAYTSLWDNYPDSITVALSGRARYAYLLMAGSTNHMQFKMDNAVVTATYADGATQTMPLVNPYNWCPIEQDFFVDGKAFTTVEPRPYRVSLGTGDVSRDLGQLLNITPVYGREIPGGAATMLKMPLNPGKKLRSLTVRTLSNDVVVGLMAITLQRD